MKRHSVFLASAALAAVLTASSSAWAQMGVPNVRLGNPDYPYDAVYNPGSWGYYGSPNYNYAYNYGSPYGYAGYSYDYGSPFGFLGAVTAPIAAIASAPVTAVTGSTAPLITGRSVATNQSGNFCSTPVKTCELYHASFVGNGCSCRTPSGRARGSVTP